VEIDAEILAHYAEGLEDGRLTSGPSLELLRTQVLLERFLPAPPARVLDVGGASGTYASWLSDRGYQVHLIDPVPLHLEQARADGRFTVAPGDARSLPEEDGSYDAVLLLGPLYHLTTGQHRNPGSDPGFFTTAYFHDRAGIASEITDSGLRLRDLLPVEGLLHWAPGIQDRLSDPAQRQLILATLAAMEHDPAIAGATSHLLAIGQHPSL
jgi:SAM-dependent methyltransferase